MPGSLTDAEEVRLLDLSLNGTYLNPVVAQSGEAGTPTEASTARQAVPFAAAANGAKVTTSDLVFTFATGPVTIVGYGVWSAATGGSERWYYDLEGGNIVLGAAGGTVTFPAGSSFGGN